MTVGIFKLIDGIVEHRRDIQPAGIGHFRESVHFDGDLFASLAAAFAPREVRGDKTSMAMEPAAKLNAGGERTRLAGEVGENGLDHVLRLMGVAANAAESDRVNKVDVARD